MDRQRVDDLVNDIKRQLEQSPPSRREASITVTVGDHHTGPIFVGRETSVPYPAPNAVDPSYVVPLADYLALQHRLEAELLASRRRGAWWSVGALMLGGLVVGGWSVFVVAGVG